MARCDRRSFIAGAAALTTALAGCSTGGDAQNNAGEPADSGGGGNDDGSGGADDGGSGGGQDSPDAQTIADESLRVHEDEYQRYSFELNRTATVSWEFTVRDGPAIDVFITSPDEFDHYTNGDRFKVYESSQDSTGGSASARLEAGQYYLVVDNTSAGWADPPSNMNDDVAEVDFKATVEG